MKAEPCFSVDDIVHSRGFVSLLLLPAPRQVGKACSASCVLFSYSCKNSFDLTAESFAHFFTTCNFWYQLKSLTIPEAIRHSTRETQEHCVTNNHFAAAPSAYGCSCRMCDFLGRMVLVKKNGSDQFSVLVLGVVRGLRSSFCAGAWCGLRRRETSLLF